MSTAGWRCPRDGATLDVGTFHGEPFAKCPTCNGAFFQQRSLQPVLRTLSEHIRSTVPLDYPIDTVQDKGGGLACPRCGLTMEHYGYMGDRHVMIDSCADCRCMWTDAEELGAMSLLHARDDRIADDRRAWERQSEDWRHATVDSHMIARAVEAGILAGGVGGAFLICFLLSARDGEPFFGRDGGRTTWRQTYRGSPYTGERPPETRRRLDEEHGA